MKRLRKVVSMLVFAARNPGLVVDVIRYNPAIQQRLVRLLLQLVGVLGGAYLLWRTGALRSFLRRLPGLRQRLAAPVDAEAAARSGSWDLRLVQAAIHEQGVTVPAAFVELGAFDRNVERFAGVALARGKTIRVATKSIRCPELIRRVLDHRVDGRAAFKGVMCYSVAEAAFLHRAHGVDDLLVAYPAVQPSELATAYQLVQDGVQLVLTVDCMEHLYIIRRHWQQQDEAAARPALVSLDVDVSWRPFNGAVHVGVQRSPLREWAQIERLLDALAEPGTARWLRLCGVMAYDAQVAGLPDASPFDACWLQLAKGVVKQLAYSRVLAKRRTLQQLLAQRGLELDWYNGGGTGSFVESLEEPWLTEVTVGSGLLQSALFDYYRDRRGVCEPAMCFALPVTRTPEPHTLTCHGGGFVASGAVDPSKQPLPFLPRGMASLPAEGFGEVQTPVRLDSGTQVALGLRVGSALLFRPAKAGEIAEHFAVYHLLHDQRYVRSVPTYRGLEQTFY